MLKPPLYALRPEAIAGPPHEPATPRSDVPDRSIGAFIRRLRKLDDAQIEQILHHQREHNLRFGESAVRLKLASNNDVLWALSQQFEYPYATDRIGDGFNDELVAAIDPFSDQSEVFREIRSQLILGVMAPDQHRRPLAVLSPDVGDGKTFFAANLAVSFSQLGARTLVIDADMRTPRLHALFGVPNELGLSTILSGRAEHELLHPIPMLPSLYVLPVGVVPPNPIELVQRPAFALLMHQLCARFDHVIVDTPASSHGADARVLAAQCGSAMAICRRGNSRMSAVNQLVNQVARHNGRFAGVLINEH
ncbi:MAG TPA: polysaccharide biosynthesis tyrosine autokinase [Burkholderiaceae bacterium]|jgi:chain length determinant protein tyrosine kinase EpsG